MTTRRKAKPTPAKKPRCEACGWDMGKLDLYCGHCGAHEGGLTAAEEHELTVWRLMNQLRDAWVEVDRHMGTMYSRGVTLAEAIKHGLTRKRRGAKGES